MANLKIRKKPYTCFDGPWVGQVLYLATPLTLSVQVGPHYGRYKLDRDYPMVLIWEELDGPR